MIVYGPASCPSDAHALVEKFHYSGRAVKNSSIVVVASFDSEVLAACFFFSPAARWKEPVLELCRLVRHPLFPEVSLSTLISVGAKVCKKAGHTLLVSFADSTNGHHGGVYQAASWSYHGLRPTRCDGFYINGVFKPRRSCNELYGTSGFSALKAALPDADIVQHFDTGKHLYWKALNKNGVRKAERLGLIAAPYPKPDKK